MCKNMSEWVSEKKNNKKVRITRVKQIKQADSSFWIDFWYKKFHAQTKLIRCDNREAPKNEIRRMLETESIN